MIMKNTLKTLTAILLGGVAIITANAQSTNPVPLVQLCWTASISPNVTNYILFQGTNSGVYDTQYNVGTNTCIQSTNIQRGVTYYWRLSSQDSSGIIGPYTTNEVSYTASRGPSPPTAITITIETP